MHPLIKSFSQKAQSQPRSARRVFLGIFLLLWSVLLGMGFAQARPVFATSVNDTMVKETIAQAITPDPEGLVDVVPPELQFGQELYLENCATCHVGLPPAVLPTEIWRTILTDPNHYGVQITPFSEPSIYVVWNYISLYSRPLRDNEPPPYRLRSSRYFRVLHPKVEFGDRVTLQSCIGCHPGAEQFNYRSLTAEWEDAP
ncbi:cytochrome C [filamentous cyanobacterium CCP1]|nr:cytochrome C [filamentous cyanobacterium CCP2]PSB67172.1 cytochrome C [filamentous cyanobacterium CCP1]